MGLLSSIKRAFGIGELPAKAKKIRGAYDASQPGIDRDHWQWADALNANAAHSAGVRKTLRERARYEYLNNSYCKSVIDRLASDMVGKCPRIQLTIPGASRESVRQVEQAFSRWCQSIGLGEKLRMMDAAAIRDGESFALFISNPLVRHPVQLDLRLYETDQVRTPFIDYLDVQAFDGGRLDENGNVVEWHFMKAHPGSDVWYSAFQEYQKIPADRVVHWFRPLRAGQVRGVPEISSSLSLYAYLRRYTLATVHAAENASNIAGVLETDTLPEDGSPSRIEAMDEIAITRGSLLTIPNAWKAKGFDATQPTSTYREFKGELLTEAGSCVGAPRNVSTASSAEYNYSSGRLDVGIYHRGLDVRRGDFGVNVLNQIAHAWLQEASRIPGYLPPDLPAISYWGTGWFFDGFQAIDPVKEAQALQINLANNVTNLAEVYAEYGQDWETQLRQRAKEIALMNSLGIPVGTSQQISVTKEETSDGQAN